MNFFYWILLIGAGVALHQFPAYDLTFTMSIGLALALVGVIGLIRNIF